MPESFAEAVKRRRRARYAAAKQLPPAGLSSLAQRPPVEASGDEMLPENVQAEQVQGPASASAPPEAPPPPMENELLARSSPERITARKARLTPSAAALKRKEALMNKLNREKAPPALHPDLSSESEEETAEEMEAVSLSCHSTL